MADQNQSIDTDADEAAPTWEEMREDGRMLIDDEHQKLAVYPGSVGSVVLMSQEFQTGIHYIALEPDEVSKLIEALGRSYIEANEISADLEAKYEAHVALESAQQGAKHG